MAKNKKLMTKSKTKAFISISSKFIVQVMKCPRKMRDRNSEDHDVNKENCLPKYSANYYDDKKTTFGVVNCCFIYTLLYDNKALII